MSATGRAERGGEGLDFFPTRPEVTRAFVRMVRPFFLARRKVLDPAAGTGAILDVVRDLFPAVNTFGIEIDAGRFEALRAAGHPAVCADYLQGEADWREDIILANQPFDLQDPFVATYLRRFRFGGVRLAAWISRSAWFEGKTARMETDRAKKRGKRNDERAKLVDELFSVCTCTHLESEHAIPCEGLPPACQRCGCDEFGPALRRWPISPRPPFGRNGSGKIGNDATCYEWTILHGGSVILPVHRAVRWTSDRPKALPIPECPKCKDLGDVMPARCLPRPESAEGKPLGCAACGDGIDATKAQIRAAKARESAHQLAAKKNTTPDAIEEQRRRAGEQAARTRREKAQQLTLIPGV